MHSWLAPPMEYRPRVVVALQDRAECAAVADWLEGGNADLDTQFWARDPGLAVNRAFNDHVVAIDRN